MELDIISLDTNHFLNVLSTLQVQEAYRQMALSGKELESHKAKRLVARNEMIGAAQVRLTKHTTLLLIVPLHPFMEHVEEA